MQVLQIGCGALGQRLAQATLALGHALTVVRRSALPVPVGATHLQIDVTDASQCQQLAHLKPQMLLYCLAPQESVQAAYQQVYFQGLVNVLNAVSMDALRHVFFISSTRVYGERQGEWIDDDTPAVPADAGGQTLLDAEHVLQRLNCGHTACRVSGIYGLDRRYLIQLAQTPARWPQASNWSNRIHEDDVVGAVMHFYQTVTQALGSASPPHNHGLPEQVILTDGVPTLQHTVLQWMVSQMGWSPGATQPLSPQGGKRLRNQGLLATGYALKYADFKQGYAPILAALAAEH